MNVNLFILKGHPQGESLSFPTGEYIFGRGMECHVRPNSPWVSRQHCLLRVAESKVVLQDLGSTNGTLVNSHRLIGERELFDGDELQIGPLVLTVQLEQSAVMDASEIRDALREASAPADRTNHDEPTHQLESSEPKPTKASA